MLTIRDAGNNDLSVTPPVPNTRQIASGRTPVAVYVTVSEDDPDMPFHLVGAVVDWNDGVTPVSYPGPHVEQASPLVVSAARELGFGDYVITVVARNNRAPVPDTVRASFRWTISPLTPNVTPRRALFGPVLPRDAGQPNNSSWMFDVGNDLQVLQSNLKMLLLTTKGERVMEPNYGTQLRRILFELKLASVETLIQQEISQAVAMYEPRVTVQALAVKRSQDSSVSVEVTFLSRQTRQPFDLNLQFAQ